MGRVGRSGVGRVGPGVEGGIAAGGTGPGLWLLVPQRVDQVGFLVGAPPAPWRVGVDLVHTSDDPPYPSALDLVAHGVGEGLGGRPAVDAVAVVVEEGVERPQRQPPVHAEDGSARRSEAAPPEFDRFGMGRRHREVLGIGWLAAHAVRPPAPQRFVEFVELVEDRDAAARQLLELPVEVGELHPQDVALGLELAPPLVRDLLALAQRLRAAEALALLALGAGDDPSHMVVVLVRVGVVGVGGVGGVRGLFVRHGGLARSME